MIKVPSLIPIVEGARPDDLSIYFSPVFITPDVLLGRKSQQVIGHAALAGGSVIVCSVTRGNGQLFDAAPLRALQALHGMQTFGACQIIDDDILYLAAPAPRSSASGNGHARTIAQGQPAPTSYAVARSSTAAIAAAGDRDFNALKQYDSYYDYEVMRPGAFEG